MNHSGVVASLVFILSFIVTLVIINGLGGEQNSNTSAQQYTQQLCQPTSDLFEKLELGYGETLEKTDVSTSTNISIHLFTSEGEEPSWTLVLEHNWKNKACIIDSGDGWATLQYNFSNEGID